MQQDKLDALTEVVASSIEQFGMDAIAGKFAMTSDEWRATGRPFIRDAALELAVQVTVTA